MAHSESKTAGEDPFPEPGNGRRSRSVFCAALALVLAAGCVPEESTERLPEDVDVGFRIDASFDAGQDPGDGGADAADADADGSDTGDAGDAGTPFDWGVDPPNSCNGALHLCDRRIDEVAYVTTHNAYSTSEDRFLGPNQTHTMRRQLADGVRGLMLDIYDNGRFDASLCHSNCAFGELSLVDGLNDVAAFLDARPGNVVTLILESYVTGDLFWASLEEAGLDRRVWIPDDDSLPTLGQLIDAGTQLIILTNRDAGAFPGYLDVWSWAWDTDWSNTSTDDFDCDRLRGDTSNPLFILNHFLTDPLGSPSLAEQANSNPFLRERVEQCRVEAGQLPNYITVDFYEVGDVFEVVDELNAE